MILSLQDKAKSTNLKHSEEINMLNEKLSCENDTCESMRLIIDEKEAQIRKLDHSLKEVDLIKLSLNRNIFLN
jgi:hypothetical protein